jgi:acetoin utilization deacetylase AcuC-like enzyme
MVSDDSQAERPPTGLVYDDAYLRHLTGAGHPEAPQRLEAIVQRLRADGLLKRLKHIEPLKAKMEWIRAVHTDSYIETVKRDIASGQVELSTGDTTICKESFNVALRAVGGVVAAVEAVMSGTVRNAFCAVRPPGHHATPDCGMGFCIFNNAAIATRYAQQHRGVKKVLIADWDIHHGNGTQDAFYEDGSVFYFSTHLDGLYPMPLTGKGRTEETGNGDGAGTNLNVPLPPGIGDKEIIAAFTEKLAPAAKAFDAELGIISAGFDSRVGDPLGVFNITDEGFAKLTKIVMGLVPVGRIVSTLEGGYNPVGLASAVAAHVKTLMKD